MHILLTEILPSRVIIIIHLQKGPTKVSPPSNGKYSKIHGARRESWARDLYRGRMGKLNNLENASSLSLNFPHPSSTHWHSSWFPRHRINTHTFNSFLNTRNTPICPYSLAKNPSSFFFRVSLLFWYRFSSVRRMLRIWVQHSTPKWFAGHKI